MQKIYRIGEEKQSRYALRKAGAFTTYIVIGVVLIFAVSLSQVDDVGKLIAIVEWKWFFVIVVAMLGIRYVQELNLAKAMVFDIGETYVARYFHR